MPIPHIFEAGEIAHAQEVNDNFAYLQQQLGSATDENVLRPPGPLLMGPRRNIQIGANQDTTGVVDPQDANSAFLSIGWNAEMYDTGFVDTRGRPIYNYRRFAQGERATAVQIGEDGLTVLTTDRLNGDLHSQLTPAFGVHPVESIVHLPDTYSIKRRKNNNINSEEYRLLYTPLTNNPVALARNRSMNKGKTTHRLTEYPQIPDGIRAVNVYFSGKCRPDTLEQETVSFYQSGETKLLYTGFMVTFPPGTNKSRAKIASGSGIVSVGQVGQHRHRIVIERSINLLDVDIYITGFFS